METATIYQDDSKINHCQFDIRSFKKAWLPKHFENSIPRAFHNTQFLRPLYVSKTIDCVVPENIDTPPPKDG